MSAEEGPSLYSPSNGTMPGYDGEAVTPSDNANLDTMARALYIGGNGNIKLVTSKGNTLEFIGVQQGSILPIQTIKVFSTSTTAANLIAIY